MGGWLRVGLEPELMIAVTLAPSGINSDPPTNLLHEELSSGPGCRRRPVGSPPCLQVNLGTINHAPEARDAVRIQSAQEGHC